MINQFIDMLRDNHDLVGIMAAVFAGLLVWVIALIKWRRRDALDAANTNRERLRTDLSNMERAHAKQSDALVEAEKRITHFEALEGPRLEDQEELKAMRDLVTEQQAEIARLNEAITQQQRANVEKQNLLAKNGEELKSEFKSLAAQVVRRHGEDFEKTNAERMKQVLEPLKQHIDRFETELRDVHKSADKERTALRTEILNLTKQSLQVSREAENLTKALKSDTQKQGAWGEMILASILERSGLREGQEYEVQVHHRSDEGRSLRPDVIVHLPGDRRLVIDSKVSLVAYERAMNTENEALRDGAMQAHVNSVRNHIDTLSAKRYHQLDDGAVDYVIMFMPIESAFAEAVGIAPDLSLYATEKNVVIASPTNLMVALKTIENLWSVERRNKNAAEIADRAGKLYEKFNGFVTDMSKIGDRLDQAQQVHEAAMAKLTFGRGNLTSQVEMLKKLGARTDKQIALEHDQE